MTLTVSKTSSVRVKTALVEQQVQTTQTSTHYSVPGDTSTMSRRNNPRRRSNDNSDRDSSLGTAGKVAIGVAVAAAAGAAIGYLGSRLLSSWTAETDDKKDKEKKKCGEESEGDRSLAEPSSHCSVGDNKTEGVERSVGGARSSAELTVKLSLQEQLSRYYSDYVDIPQASMQPAQQVVDTLIVAVSQQLRNPSMLQAPGVKIGDLVLFGSTTEGVQVVRSDCFDVMIPILFSAQTVHAQHTDDSGKHVIVIDETDCISDELCDSEHRLVTAKLLEKLQRVIVQAETEYQLAAHTMTSGGSSLAAVEVDVSTLSGLHVTANFVPFVIIDSHLYMSAAVPSVNERQSTLLWMESYTRQEKWSMDRFDSSVTGHLVVLKVLKAIRLNHRDEFGAVTSYHIKTVLLNVLEDVPDSCEWEVGAASERLIDVLMALRDGLAEQQLMHYFERDINMLEDVPVDSCTNLAKFIDKKLALNDIASLLVTDF